MHLHRRFRTAAALAAGFLALTTATATPAIAQYRQHITNDMATCDRGGGPAVRVTVTGIRAATGSLRVQSYRGTAADWLQKGRWLSRIEVPARSGTMAFCLPVPAAGTYAIAVRHDRNGDGTTNINGDGGGMSNNPSINIFNLGKPGIRSTAFQVGEDVRSITINMRYM